MPARRKYSPAEEEVYRILSGYTRRKLLLGQLEKEQGVLADRLRELATQPVRAQEGDPTIPGGWWSARRNEALAQEIADLMRDQEIYEALLASLEPLEREIVRLRHEENRTWLALGRRVFLCDRQAQRVYRAAIRKMSKTRRAGIFFTNH